MIIQTRKWSWKKDPVRVLTAPLAVPLVIYTVIKACGNTKTIKDILNTKESTMDRFVNWWCS